MGILSGHKKYIKRILTPTGFIEVSQQTRSDSVLFEDGTNAENKMKTLDTSMQSCLKSVSEGKKKLASTFTAKGVPMASDAAFDTMNTGLGTLETVAYNKGISATKKGTATAGQVLTGYSFTNSSGVGLSGSMPNRGALNWNPVNSTSYTVPAGYYSGGTLNSSSAYSNGYNNGYNTGYPKGVADADNRANPGCVNYQTGYNNGYGAGAASKPTIYTGEVDIHVTAYNTFETIRHPEADNFAIWNAVKIDEFMNLWIRIVSNSKTEAKLHCSGQGVDDGIVSVKWIAW